MKFGVAFIPDFAAAETVALARLADDLGFDYLFLPDQTFHRDPFSLLALCAVATSRIQLGVGVVNPYTRHPIQLARAAGTISEVSDGRFILGLGAGNGPHVLRGFGLTHDRVLARVRESVDVIRRLLAGEEVTHSSPTLQVTGVRLDFESKATVPIYIASRNPNMLKLAGEIADGALFEGLPQPSAIAYAFGQLEASAATREASLAPIQSAAWQMLFLEDGADVYRREDVLRWARLVISTTKPEVLTEMGFQAEHLIEGSVPDLNPEALRRLFTIGGPESIREQIGAAATAGVETFVGVLHGNAAAVQHTMERLASEVVPALEARHRADPAVNVSP